MKYNSFYDEQNTDSVIQFNNVHSIGTTIVSDIVGVENNYIRDDKSDTELITSKDANIINAIDIDWNGANVDLLGKNTVLNTSGQLLGFYKDSINTSYDLANSAYNLAQTAIEANNIDQDTISQIQSILSNGVVTSLTNNTNHHVTGDIKLTSSVSETDLPILIYQGTKQFSFGISKNELLSYLKTTDLGGEGIEYSAGNGININDYEISVNTDIIATKEYVNDKIDDIEIPQSIEYSAGDGIVIDDNYNISVNTNVIATKEYVDNNCITEIFVTDPISKSTSGGNPNPEIGIKLDDTYFTTKLITGSVKSLTLTDEIIRKINSASGQGIEYTSTSGSGITVNNTNHTISIDNTVALKSEIPNVSNYLTKGGETTGTLAVINGTQVNASTATTDGTDIYVSSDRRLKDNILDITDGEVERLFETESGNMHYFEWKENHKPSFGFIAQELIHFAPETVTQDSEYMQVNYNAALTKTCAALFKKIKQLEKRIKILEGES